MDWLPQFVSIIESCRLRLFLDVHTYHNHSKKLLLQWIGYVRQNSTDLKNVELL